MAREAAIPEITGIVGDTVERVGVDADVEFDITETKGTTASGESTNIAFAIAESPEFNDAITWYCTIISPGQTITVDDSSADSMVMNDDSEFDMPSKKVKVDLLVGGYDEGPKCRDALSQGSVTDSATFTMHPAPNDNSTDFGMQEVQVTDVQMVNASESGASFDITIQTPFTFPVDATVQVEVTDDFTGETVATGEVTQRVNPLSQFGSVQETTNFTANIGFDKTADAPKVCCKTVQVDALDQNLGWTNNTGFDVS